MTAALVRFFFTPPVWVEIFGYTLIALVALEIVVGKRRLGLPGRGFFRTHVTLAWTFAGLLGIHALIGVGHGLVGFVLRSWR